MNLQDVGFFIVLAILFIVRKPIWFVYTGLLCFALAIPLFAKWVFFTGERMTWYGAAFVFMSIMVWYWKKE